MCRWIVSRECLIKGKDWPEIQIHLLTKFPVDLMHVPGKLFQQILEAIEHRVQSRLIASKVSADEILIHAGVPILSPPEFGNLQQSALYTDALSLSILLN